MKKSKILLNLIALTFVVMGFFPSEAHAATVSQTIDTYTSTNKPTFGGQTIKNLIGTFEDITFHYSPFEFASTGNTFQIIEYDGTCTTQTGHYWIYNNGGAGFTTPINTTTLTFTAAQIDLWYAGGSQTITFDPTKCYLFGHYTAGSVSTYRKGSDSDVFADGYATNGSAEPPSAMGGGMADLYFLLNAAPPPPTVYFQYPTDSSTVEGDFMNWSVESEYLDELDWDDCLAGVASSCYRYRVTYGLESMGGDYIHDDLVTSSAAGVFGIAKNYGLLNGSWQAQATVDIGHYSGGVFVSESVLATSDTIDFDVSDILISGPPVVECGETDFVCQIGNWFATNLYPLVSWLIIPSQDSITRFGDLWDTIKERAPIGYISLMNTALSGISSEGTPAFSLGSLSELSDVIGSWDTVIGVIMWVFLGFWLFRRIAKLEL